jgi:hypothetical protein
VVDPERLGLPPGAVEGEHQLHAEALAERMLGHEPLELRDEIGVAAEREVDVDTFLERRQPQLLETAGLELHEALVGEVGKRRPAPERERPAQLRRGGDEVTVRARRTRFLAEALETLQVELSRLEVQHVPGRPGDEDLTVGAEQLAQPRDVPVQRGRGGLRRLLSP